MSRFTNALIYLGFDFHRCLNIIKNYNRYKNELKKFKSKCNPKQIGLIKIYPLVTDYSDNAGQIGGHYFYQDLWAARKIFSKSISLHYDIGSRIDGFISHLLVFTKVCLIDIRPLNFINIQNLSFIQSDATLLNNFDDNSISSLSSLHAIEHFGLGRYGDPIDPDACFKAMKSLQRILKPGGKLYFSVPIGKETIYFNAHRVFSPNTILSCFHELKLESFSCVDDNGVFHESSYPEKFNDQHFACGMFEFIKL